MAKSGRKRAQGVKRSSSGQRLRTVSGSRDDTMAPALARRNGNTDQRAGDSLGEFTIKHRLRRELYDAAMHYWKIRNAWRQAMDCPGAIYVGRDFLGNGQGMTREQVKKLERQIDACEAAMTGASQGGFALINQMFDAENMTPHDLMIQPIIASLMANARILGMIGAFHPYIGSCG